MERKAMSEAEKEIKEKQIKSVKDLALKILEQIEKERDIRDAANRNIKILQKDIEDLKAGRLDRIEERQKRDLKAKAASCALIERASAKEHSSDYYYIDSKRWYEPWKVTSPADETNSFMITNSLTADYTGGAYILKDGTIIHI